MSQKHNGYKAYTTCSGCGNWAWNWRLKKQKGKCGVCGETCFYPDPAYNKRGGGRQVGGGESAPSPDALLQQYLVAAGLSADSTARGLLDQVQAQALAVAPKPRPKCPYVLQREAAALCAQKQHALNQASERLVGAETKLKEAQERQLQAAAELFDANQQRLAAQESVQAKEAPKQSEGGFGVDPDLFDHIDEFEEEVQTQLRDFKTQLEAASDEAKRREKVFQDLLAQARKALEAPKKKRKGPEGEAQAAEDPNAAKAPSAAQQGAEGASEATGSKGGGKGAPPAQLSPEAKARRDAAVSTLAANARAAKLETANGGDGAAASQPVPSL